MDGFTHIEGPALKNKRNGHSCGVMSNGQQSKIVVAGGFHGSVWLSSVEILDTNVNKWIAGPELPYKLWNSAMATSPDGGGVILFGGEKGSAILSTNLEVRFDA